MSFFTYNNGVLNAEKVPLSDIAARVGTPFYCYSSAALLHSYQALEEEFANKGGVDICYSVKANSNLAVVATLAAAGAGADVVSEGELRRALAAGIPSDCIVFSGVGKTDRELIAGLEAGIAQFNVESEPELERLNALACERQCEAPVALRINPDIDAQTHEKITTGRSDNKFGIDWRTAQALYGRGVAMAGVHMIGIGLHIGSQITTLTPFEEAFQLLASLVTAVRADGHEVSRLDLGGGLGVPYEPGGGLTFSLTEYADMIEKTLGSLGCCHILEPGRFLAAQAGALVASVVYEKEGEHNSLLIIDAAMNDLIRPALYNARHTILPVREVSQDTLVQFYDVVGPICETSDVMARYYPLPPCRAGDLIALMDTGAYGAVQASTYNSRPLVPEVMVQGRDMAIIRPRQSLEELLAMDTMPDWLEP
ncbi:MAG: diaminopimelate decarboxylase [Parvularculales bacterium]